MADQHAPGGSTATADPHEGSRGRGKFGPWPWIIAFFVLLGGLTAIDLAFFWDDDGGDTYGEADYGDEE
jgi:hypothetical protein